ncbi:ribokinase [Halobacillus seohaensis]|uniref:Ribokinase n=1 Tax=Halobacillus seohaensis TaxID=447421 RepID=A0ABW2EF81_9BACI
MKTPKITVVGSINMDLLTTISRIPNNGETNFGEAFTMKPGGKGANQAVAATRLGGDVSFIGKVGNDAIGKELLELLKKENIQTSTVGVSESRATGVANILLNDHDNRIMVVSGANEEVTVEFVESFKDTLRQSDVVLSQLEVPKETVEWCASFCKDHGIPFILNPAPAIDLPQEAWADCTYITPNEEEAEKLFLENNYKDQLITTLGPRGASYNDKIIPSVFVEVVDTTGAGDTFNGALAFYLGAEYSVEKAIAYANVAASFTVESVGAQVGMPSADQVESRRTF